MRRRTGRGDGPYSAWIPKGHNHVTPFDPEELKVLLDEMCAEADVTMEPLGMVLILR